jgi:hypothetical protein
MGDTRLHALGDLTLHLHTEEGKTLTVQDAPQVTPRAMIHTLVKARLIPGVDRQGHSIEWCLDDKEAGRTLDGVRTLQENRVRSGHNLYLRRVVKTDLTLHIHTEDGRAHTLEASPQVKAELIVQDLIRSRLVPGIDEQGHPIVWGMVDQDTGKTLDPAKTLLENVVSSGRHFSLQRPEIEAPPQEVEIICKKCGAKNPGPGRFCRDCGTPLTALDELSEPVSDSTTLDRTRFESPPKLIRLQIQAEGGTPQSVKIAANAKTEELVDRVAAEFGLRLVDPDGRPTEWALDDWETGSTLIPGRSLEEQGVLNGHSLFVHQMQQPPPRLILPLILAGLGVVLVAALGIWAWLTWEIPVEVITSPAGARVLIDGKDRGSSPVSLRLAKGSHQIEVENDKYEPTRMVRDVRRGLPPVYIEMTPLALPDLWLSTNQPVGAAQFDGYPLEQAEAGYERKAIPEGDHTVTILSPDGQAAAAFGLKSRPGSVPEVSAPPMPNSAILIFVTGWNGQAQVFFTSPQPVQLSVQVDTNPAVGLSSAGFNFPLSTGVDHTLTFSFGTEQWTMPVKPGSDPVLAVFIASAETQPVPPIKTTATLVVKVTPELDGVQVLVNNASRGSTRHGSRVVSGLPAGSYTVRVAKEGYESSPGVASAQLKPGAARTLAFSLRPNPGPPLEASLEIQNALPSSEVFLDGARVGTTSADGTFSWGHIAAGTHSLKLEHYEYQTEEIEKYFVGGQATTVTADQKRAWLVIINTAPPPTQITYRAGNGPEQVVNAGPKWLPPGTYTFSAHWGDKQCSQDANVVPNPDNTPVILTFRPNCK